MEHNVVSLETAKKLREAGFPQKHCFAAYGDRRNDDDTTDEILVYKGNRDSNDYIYGWSVAPTAQEVADELPKMIEHEGHHYWLRMQWPLTDSRCQYWSDTANKRLLSTNVYNGALGVGDTMAESLADLWLTLKKQEKLGKINFSRE